VSAPTPPPVPPARGLPSSRTAAQAALAAFGLCLVALLAYRTYSPSLTVRPTDEVATPPPAARPVDLNTANRADLLQLPGVGPTLADAILTHRTGHGRFDAVDDLSAVPGVGGKTLDRLRPLLTVAEPEVATLQRKPRAEPPAPAPPSGASAPPRGGKVQPGDPKIDVNAATEAELQRLPRVGPVLAAAIVAARAEKRFASVDDLRRVRGIGAKTLDSLRPFVTAGE
jgi:competence protein ComEA